MRASRGIAVALAAAIGIPCAATSAFGQESGSFSAIATYVRDFTTVEHAEGAYFGGKLEGSTTILASSGGPFVGRRARPGRMRGLRQALGRRPRSPDCLHLNQHVRRHALPRGGEAGGRRGRGGGGQGQLELAGGTGAYAGLKGSCAYETSYLANNQVVTTTDCTWHRD